MPIQRKYRHVPQGLLIGWNQYVAPVREQIEADARQRRIAERDAEYEREKAQYEARAEAERLRKRQERQSNGSRDGRGGEPTALAELLEAIRGREGMMTLVLRRHRHWIRRNAIVPMTSPSGTRLARARERERQRIGKGAPGPASGPADRHRGDLTPCFAAPANGRPLAKLATPRGYLGKSARGRGGGRLTMHQIFQHQTQRLDRTDPQRMRHT